MGQERFQMSDVTSYIQTGLTIFTTISALILGYLKIRDAQVTKEAKDEQVCKLDMQQLQTKVAVLEERLDNEINILDKLGKKLDEIRDKL